MSRLTDFIGAGGVECEFAGEGVDLDPLFTAARQAPQQSFSTSTGAAMTTVIRPPSVS